MGKTTDEDSVTIPQKALYTPDELARYFQVHRNTIYEWISQGYLDEVRIGGIVRVPAKSVFKVFSPST